MDWPHSITTIPTDPPPAVFYAVYRARNAMVVTDLLRHWPDVQPVLWALDQVAAPLESLTIGSGPGAKFDLLNRMLDQRPPEGRWAVFSDDDYRMVRGDLPEFLAVAAAGRFDLAQPAHVPDSHWSHHVTVAQPRSRARVTRMVEIGPVFAVAPGSPLLPFPDDAGMGWGLDFEWSASGLRLGVVDQVRIRHLTPVGGDYDLAGEQDRQVITPEQEAARTVERVGRVWRPWARRPPGGLLLRGVWPGLKRRDRLRP